MLRREFLVKIIFSAWDGGTLRAFCLAFNRGDGHLSVIDIRSNKSTPLTVSEDQEDELLSIVPIKGGQKAIVGSGLGILSVWNRQLGWADCGSMRL